MKHVFTTSGRMLRRLLKRLKQTLNERRHGKKKHRSDRPTAIRYKRRIADYGGTLFLLAGYFIGHFI